MTYHRPGQYIDEVLQPVVTPVNPSVAVAAFTGYSYQGPTVPVLVPSWASFQNIFGGFVSGQDNTLAYAVYSFFNNNGGQCYVLRTVHGDGSTASRGFSSDAMLFPDTATFPEEDVFPGERAGVTKNILAIQAISEGSWGNQLYLEWDSGSTALVRTLTIRLVPNGVSTITNGQIVERWPDVSLDPAAPRYIISLLDNVGGTHTGSQWIDVALAEGYTYTSGDVIPLSDAPGGDPLVGGSDGSATTGTDIVQNLVQLDTITQPLVLNAPGWVDPTTVNGIVAYADPALTRNDGQPGRGDVIVIGDAGLNEDVDSALERTSGYAESSYLATYYPSIVIPDPAVSIRGVNKLIAPGGAVAGQYLSNDTTRGFFVSPAGTKCNLRGVVNFDPAATLSNPNLDALNDGHVNALRYQPISGIQTPVIFGGRTFDFTDLAKWVNVRRTLIAIKSQLLAITAPAIFENNDTTLWNLLATQIDQYLRSIWTQGALKGATPAAAYFIQIDSNNNTENTINNGELHVAVGVAPETPVEFVVIEVSQTPGVATATESAAA